MYSIYLYYRCKKWRINSRGEHLDKLTVKQLHQNRRLCAAHFENSQFMNINKRDKLTPKAIPTIFNVPNPPTTITPKRADPQKRKKLTQDGPDQKKLLTDQGKCMCKIFGIDNKYVCSGYYIRSVSGMLILILS